MCNLTKVHKLTKDSYEDIVKVACEETQGATEENAHQSNKMKLTGFKTYAFRGDISDKKHAHSTAFS